MLDNDDAPWWAVLVSIAFLALLSPLYLRERLPVFWRKRRLGWAKR